jgi:hypothetical protein
VSIAFLTWLEHDVIGPSWPSLLTALLVLRGYWLIGRKRRQGWWYVIASQAGLLAIAVMDRQIGLVVALPLAWQAFQNWRRWGLAGGPA